MKDPKGVPGQKLVGKSDDGNDAEEKCLFSGQYT